MTTRAKTSTPARASTKTRRKVAHSDGREALLEATITAMATAGPARVHPNEICQELGLSKSLVNFHFGGRDGLISEALTISYERYVDELMEAADKAGSGAVDRMLAWTAQQISWTITHPGTACGLDFFEQGSSVEGELASDLRDRLTVAGEKNLRNLLSLVAAARAEIFADDPDFVDDPMFASHTASTIGWLTMGEAIWLAGRHLPSNDSGEVAYLFPLAMQFVREVIVSLLSRRPDDSGPAPTPVKKTAARTRGRGR